MECIDNLKVKVCIRDNDEKLLLVVCIINICFYGKYVDVLLYFFLNYDRNVSFLLNMLNMYVIFINFYMIVVLYRKIYYSNKIVMIM